MTENKELLIKTLLYRSLHRGCKETDILLGVFAQNKINDLSDEDLQLYSDLVLEDDVLIYDWILQKISTPLTYQPLICSIRQFHKL